MKAAEEFCLASEQRLCASTAKSVLGLRAQIEELKHRFSLDEHRTQPEATQMLFESIINELSRFKLIHRDENLAKEDL